MVQDPSFGHEIAVDTYRTGPEGSTDGQWHSLRYVSDSHTGPGNAALQSGEVRWHDLQLLYCVSVPAETAWARHQYAQRATQRWQHAAATGNGAKQSEDTPAHTDTEKAMLTRLSAKHPLPEEEHSRGVVVKASKRLYTINCHSLTVDFLPGAP